MPPRFTKALAETTLTLPVGGSTAVELPFAASPQPKVTWSFNGGKLPDAKRFKTHTVIGMTSVTMAKLVRQDAGKYAVSVENEHGKCELTVTLVVLGKPLQSHTSLAHTQTHTHTVPVVLMTCCLRAARFLWSSATRDSSNDAVADWHVVRHCARSNGAVLSDWGADRTSSCWS